MYGIHATTWNDSLGETPLSEAPWTFNKKNHTNGQTMVVAVLWDSIHA